MVSITINLGPVVENLVSLLLLWAGQRPTLSLISTLTAWTGVDPFHAVLWTIVALFLFLRRYLRGSLEAEAPPFGNLLCGQVFLLLSAHALHRAVVETLRHIVIDLGGLFYLRINDSVDPIEARTPRTEPKGIFEGFPQSTIQSLVLFRISVHLVECLIVRLFVPISNGLTSVTRMLDSAPLQPGQPGQALPPCTVVDVACHSLCRLLGVPYGRLGEYCLNLAVPLALIRWRIFPFSWVLAANPWNPLLASLVIIEVFDGLRLGPLPEPWVPGPRFARRLINYLIRTIVVGLLACSFAPPVRTLFVAAAGAGGEGSDSPWVTVVSLMVAYRALRDWLSGLLGQDLQAPRVRLNQVPKAFFSRVPYRVLVFLVGHDKMADFSDASSPELRALAGKGSPWSFVLGWACLLGLQCLCFIALDCLLPAWGPGFLGFGSRASLSLFSATPWVLTGLFFDTMPEQLKNGASVSETMFPLAFNMVDLVFYDWLAITTVSALYPQWQMREAGGPGSPRFSLGSLFRVRRLFSRPGSTLQSLLRSACFWFGTFALSSKFFQIALSVFRDDIPNSGFSFTFPSAILDAAIRLYGVVSGSPNGAHGVAGLSRRRADLFWVYFILFKLVLYVLSWFSGFHRIALGVCMAFAATRPASVPTSPMLFRSVVIHMILSFCLTLLVWAQGLSPLVAKVHALKPAVFSGAWVALIVESFFFPQTPGWQALDLFLQVFSTAWGYVEDKDGQAAAWLAQRLGLSPNGPGGAGSGRRTPHAAAAAAAEPAGPAGTPGPRTGPAFDYRKTGTRLYEVVFQCRRQNRDPLYCDAVIKALYQHIRAMADAAAASPTASKDWFLPYASAFTEVLRDPVLRFKALQTFQASPGKWRTVQRLWRLCLKRDSEAAFKPRFLAFVLGSWLVPLPASAESWAVLILVLSSTSGEISTRSIREIPPSLLHSSQMLLWCEAKAFLGFQGFQGFQAPDSDFADPGLTNGPAAVRKILPFLALDQAASLINSTKALEAMSYCLSMAPASLWSALQGYYGIWSFRKASARAARLRARQEIQSGCQPMLRRCLDWVDDVSRNARGRNAASLRPYLPYLATHVAHVIGFLLAYVKLIEEVSPTALPETSGQAITEGGTGADIRSQEPLGGGRWSWGLGLAGGGGGWWQGRRSESEAESEAEVWRELGEVRVGLRRAKALLLLLDE